MFMIMKQQNDAQRQEVDQIFLEKKSHEEEIQGTQGNPNRYEGAQRTF